MTYYLTSQDLTELQGEGSIKLIWGIVSNQLSLGNMLPPTPGAETGLPPSVSKDAGMPRVSTVLQIIPKYFICKTYRIDILRIQTSRVPCHRCLDQL